MNEFGIGSVRLIEVFCYNCELGIRSTYSVLTDKGAVIPQRNKVLAHEHNNNTLIILSLSLHSLKNKSSYLFYALVSQLLKHHYFKIEI